MELKLSQSILREWRIGDEHSLVYYANNQNIWRNLRDIFPHPYTLEDAEKWIRESFNEQKGTRCAVEIDRSAAGGIGLVFQDDVHRLSAEIGYWLGEEFWGRGIMTEALKAYTDYAFANFDLCRIWASVFEWNIASMRILEKAGYIFEGRMRKAVIKDGSIIDMMLYSIVI